MSRGTMRTRQTGGRPPFGNPQAPYTGPCADRAARVGTYAPSRDPIRNIGRSHGTLHLTPPVDFDAMAATK
jgi:hypothetical protein